MFSKYVFYVIPKNGSKDDSYVAVFNGSKIKGMTHAFMVYVHGGPINVVFVNTHTNKVFLMEYTGIDIPKEYYSSVEQKCDDIFFQLIDIAKFFPRDDRHNGTNSHCKALSLKDVSDEMLVSFINVYSKMMNTKSEKAIEPEEKTEEKAKKETKINDWFGVLEKDVGKCTDLKTKC